MMCNFYNYYYLTGFKAKFCTKSLLFSILQVLASSPSLMHFLKVSLDFIPLTSKNKINYGSSNIIAYNSIVDTE